MNTIIIISVFLAAFLGVFAANSILMDLFSAERERMRSKLEEQQRRQQRERARITSQQFQDLSQLAREATAGQKRRASWHFRLSCFLEQSGSDVTVPSFIRRILACLLLFGLPTYALTLQPQIAAAIALIGASLPVLHVMLKRSFRLKRMREQLPDAFDLMSRVMRSGQTISQAMQAVADEFAQPLSLEFLFCFEQMNLGLPAESALRELGRRTGLLEIRIFILSVVVHRQTGGNLAELLDKLAAVVRERFRIQGMISSLTAQGRFQAAILMGLPVFMFFLLMILNPGYEMALFQLPMLIVAALTLMLAGYLWIRKVVNFDY